MTDLEKLRDVLSQYEMGLIDWDELKDAVAAWLSTDPKEVA